MFDHEDEEKSHGIFLNNIPQQWDHKIDIAYFLDDAKLVVTTTIPYRVVKKLDNINKSETEWIEQQSVNRVMVPFSFAFTLGELNLEEKNSYECRGDPALGFAYKVCVHFSDYYEDEGDNDTLNVGFSGEFQAHHLPAEGGAHRAAGGDVAHLKKQKHIPV